MSQRPEQHIEYPLENGRLLARPGPEAHLYAFSAKNCAAPDMGRRGTFYDDRHSIEARVIDRQGPLLTLRLKTAKALPSALSGRFVPASAPPAPEPRLTPGLALPPGAAKFLDDQNGWVMGLTEAASQKKAAYRPGGWPSITLSELPHRLSPGGLSFVWRQAPDPQTGVEKRLTQYLSGSGRLLVLGETPADLEPLADFPGALFLGPAAPGTPLQPISLYTRLDQAAQARDGEVADFRNQLSELKRQEASLKAEVSRWDDLDELESRFKALGAEVARRRARWDDARAEVERAQRKWEEASLNVDRGGRKFLGFFGSAGPDEKALLAEKKFREALEAGEAAMNLVRKEEEDAAQSALNLEKRLSAAREEAESWPRREELAGRLAVLKTRQDELGAKLAGASSRGLPTEKDLLNQAPVVLALAADMAPGEGLYGTRWPSVLALVSAPPDHGGRLALAALALSAENHLVVMGDFTFWPVWDGQAPPMADGSEEKAWACLMLADEVDPLKQWLAAGGPFEPENGPYQFSPTVSRLELGHEAVNTEAALDFNYIVQPAPETLSGQAGADPFPAHRPHRRRKRAAAAAPGCGAGLRAFGEIGPANPVSALLVARAALNAEKKLGGSGPAVAVITASEAQSRLVAKILDDLQAPAGRIYTGQPQDFRYWPPLPLVILEPAFESPHTSHPWAWPAFGRHRLSLAWGLAQGRLWLAGRDGWMKKLPENSPLAALWNLADHSAPEAVTHDPRKGLAVPTFWEALDRAKTSVWAIVPTFEPFWWRPLEEHFLAASRRRVAVTILCAPPGAGADREYPSAAIRTLAAYGCSVHLAKGLPGFMAVVDGAHFTWGHFIEGSKGSHIWGGLKSAMLNSAGPEVGNILQMDLINEKLGRKSGGLKNCRVCGWPMVLINEEHMRGFGDEQPLKVGCLGSHGDKNPRRLDAREPFMSPPKCGVDHLTSYRRTGSGRAAQWVCPNHPGGPRCPNYKVAPGDAS